MPLITWSDRLSVGIPAIDNQHKKLVDMINQLHDAQREGQGKAALDKIFAAMADYTREHFTFEEKMLAAANYPQLTEHKRLHGEFLTRLTAMQARQQQATQVGLSLEVMSFLRDWLVKHIEGIDKRYTSHMKQPTRS